MIKIARLLLAATVSIIGLMAPFTTNITSIKIFIINKIFNQSICSLSAWMCKKSVKIVMILLLSFPCIYTNKIYPCKCKQAENQKMFAYHYNISKTCTSKNQLMFITYSKTLIAIIIYYTESLYERTLHNQRNSNQMFFTASKFIV